MALPVGELALLEGAQHFRNIEPHHGAVAQRQPPRAPKGGDQPPLREPPRREPQIHVTTPLEPIEIGSGLEQRQRRDVGKARLERKPRHRPFCVDLKACRRPPAVEDGLAQSPFEPTVHKRERHGATRHLDGAIAELLKPQAGIEVEVTERGEIERGLAPALGRACGFATHLPIAAGAPLPFDEPGDGIAVSGSCAIACARRPPSPVAASRCRARRRQECREIELLEREMGLDAWPRTTALHTQLAFGPHVGE